MRFLKSIPTMIVLTTVGLVSFSATAFAADAVTPADSTSLLDLLKPVYEAFSGGHYAYAAALGVVVLVALVKRYLAPKFPWLNSDAGGSAMALLAAFGTALASALAAPGATVSLAVLESALLVGVGAAGGYAVIKNLIIDPILVPLEAKAPNWAKPILALVLWIFDKGQAALDESVDAGNAAVAAKPATGIAGASGAAPTELK